MVDLLLWTVRSAILLVGLCAVLFCVLLGDGCIERFYLFLGGVSGMLWWCGVWLSSASSDVECCLHQKMVGGKCGTSVCGNILNDAFPGLWSDNVV